MSDLIERQAAIELIHSLYPSAPIMRRNRERWEEKYKPYIEAEKALEQLPSAQIEPCKDAVSRADVVDMLEMFPFTEYSEYETAREVVKRLPSAQPDVPDTNVGKMDGDELDEAIRHCDEIVQDITWFCNSPSKYIEQRRHESAVKLRQLASWLRELKRLRTEVYFLKAEKENEPVDLLGDVPCKTCKWRVTTTEKCEECIDGVSDNYEVQEPCEDAVSREAVIDVIGHSDILSTWYEMDDTDDIVAEVIDGVSDNYEVQEPCEDCVSRQAAIDAALSAFSRGLMASPDIRKLPSVQPDIVRCKDCMHYSTYYRGNESKPVITHLCKWCLDRTMEPDDYCSHAERKTDD